MKNEQVQNNQEVSKENSVTKPAIELLLTTEASEQLWPLTVAQRTELRKQVDERLELSNLLDETIAGLPRPDSTLIDGLKGGSLSESQIIAVYTALGKLISSEDYRRALLYIPFELLPTPELKNQSPELSAAANAFSKTYLTSWRSLLAVLDVRANFVDGDVLDVESRTEDLPRVVKAAHLIPELVKHELLGVDEAVALFSDAKDATLKQSCAESLWILNDLKLLPQYGVSLLEAYEEVHPRRKHSEPKKITERRKNWLQQEEIRKKIEAEASRIAVILTTRGMSDDERRKYESPNTPSEHQQALILGIQIAAEKASKNQIAATALYDAYKELLVRFYGAPDASVRERATIAFRRLASIGIAPATDLDTLGINSSFLAGPFSENLKNMKAETKALALMLEAAEHDPELNTLIYPAIVVFGSRLKGYGAEHSDIDIGVFVRPGTAPTDRTKLQQALRQTFNHEKIHGEVVQFWLDEADGALTVHDFTKGDASLGESHWTHVLFGAAWIGNTPTVQELQQKLLTPYFTEQTKTIEGIPARRLYIEELERDTLQYRLMHKGYARFFPPFSEMTAPHRDRIDGASAFWDSGYRQTAIRLYARRVFLPKI